MRRYLVAVIATLVAASAWWGAAGLIWGLLDVPSSLAERLPFASPVFGGAALAVVIALPGSVCAVLCWRDDAWEYAATLTYGLLLVVWIAMEYAIVRQFSVLQPVVAALGLVLVALGVRGAREISAQPEP